MPVFEDLITPLTAENLNKMIAGGDYDTINLRACAARLNGIGTPSIQNIAGFAQQVDDLGTGHYKIYFSSTFGSIPTVVATALSLVSNLRAHLVEVTTESVTLKITNQDGIAVDAEAHIIAIGV